MFFLRRILATADTFYHYCDDQDPRFRYEREPISWKHRRMNFIFNSRRYPGCQFHFQLVDKIRMPCRLYSVVDAPDKNIIGEVVQKDILVGYAGLAKHYKEVEKYFQPIFIHEFDRIARTVRASAQSEISTFNWIGPHVPFASVHLADPHFDHKVGDEFVLDGAIFLAAVTKAPDYIGSFEYTTARAMIVPNCVFFWPAHRNIEELADDILLMDEEAVRHRLRIGNPAMYYREEAQLEMKQILHLQDMRRQKLIQLGYKV